MTNTAEFCRHKGGYAFIFAMASGETVREASKKAGISERTGYDRASNPDWQKAIDGFGEEMFTKAAAEISTYLTDSSRKLHELLSSDSDQVALGAARALLDFGLRYRPGGESSTQHVNMAPVKAELDLSEDALAVVKALGIEEGE